MDGDGSIQVNHWRKKYLQYRLIIKLNNLNHNYDMLIKIAKVIGGTVRVVNTNKEVIWVVNKKETVIKIIDIFTFYPPLTSRLICQLKLLKVCLIENSINNYLINRNLKYNDQLNIVKHNSNYIIPNYFPSWLSGFIEAEGCFTIRASKNHFFSIGHNDDYYIIQAIKTFFSLSVMVRNSNKNFYSIETYKKETLNTIISHCMCYPLLGEKLNSLKNFVKVRASHKN